MHSYRKNAFDSLNRVNNLLSDFFKYYSVLCKKEAYIIRSRWALIQSILKEEAEYKSRKGFTLLFEASRSNGGNASVCTKKSFSGELTLYSKVLLFLFRERMSFLMHLCIKTRGLLLDQHRKEG